MMVRATLQPGCSVPIADCVGTRRIIAPAAPYWKIGLGGDPAGSSGG